MTYRGGHRSGNGRRHVASHRAGVRGRQSFFGGTAGGGLLPSIWPMPAGFGGRHRKR